MFAFLGRGGPSKNVYTQNDHARDAERACRRTSQYSTAQTCTSEPNLGFHCHKVESWKYRGHRYLQRWPSRRAMQHVRDRIKAITAPRHRLPEPIEPIVAEVNQVVRGWGAYFRVGNSTRKFQDVDRYVRERLAKFLAKKTGRGGHQRRRYTWAFFDKLGVYQLNGTVKWYTAAPIATR